MFRFTIRELLLLTLVVALGVGWWIDRGRLAEANRRLRSAEVVLLADGYTIDWSDPFGVFKVVESRP